MALFYEKLFRFVFKDTIFFYPPLLNITPNVFPNNARLYVITHLATFIVIFFFAEFLYFNNLEITDELDQIAKKIEIKRFFREYFEFGVFPEVVLSGKKNPQGRYIQLTLVWQMPLDLNLARALEKLQKTWLQSN